MKSAPLAFTALCIYREARGEGNVGMTAVGCVIRNRVFKNNSTPYTEVTKKLQFSSMTSPRDPQLAVYPSEGDISWQQAQLITQNVFEGDISDITQGATLYYDDSIPFPPSWNKNALKPLGKIGKFNLFREI